MICFGKRMHLQLKKGFSLVELIIIIAILSILAIIGISNFGNIRESATKAVCGYNLQVLYKEFQVYLTVNQIDSNIGNPHTSFLLQHDIENAGGCPSEGAITFVDNSFTCSFHSNNEDNNDDEDNEEVPYL